MSGFGELFGSQGVVGQLLIWQVGGQIFAAALDPALTAAQQEIWATAIAGGNGNVYQVVSPPDLADQVVRGIRPQQQAAGEAAKSGVTADDFLTMVQGAGEPPGLQTVLELFRRGIIQWAGIGPNQATVENAIATGRLYDYWADPLRKAYDPDEPGGGTPLSPAEAVNAALRQQAPTSDMQAEASYSGINAERFAILLNSAGRPPDPTQLIELVRRGFIPLTGTGPGVVSLEQGIYEGDVKDKYEPYFEKLVEYVPPPRIVTTLERAGAITPTQAQKYYQDAGLTADLATAYQQSITGEKMAGTKQLAQGVVLTLYEGQAITQAQAVAFLGVLGYTEAQSDFLLELYDLRREVAQLDKAIKRVGTLYTKHKITRAGAAEALSSMGVIGTQQANLLGTWDLESATEVMLPTIGEIGKAIFYGAITPEEGIAEAGRLGYQPWEAYIALSAANEGPVGAKPPNQPAPPGTA